jgi:hypothetical protein
LYRTRFGVSCTDPAELLLTVTDGYTERLNFADSGTAGLADLAGTTTRRKIRYE